MTPARITADRNPLRDPRDKRLPRIAGPCGLVLFGVTGDLARKKLMPAVYDLANRGLLPPGFSLVGFARRDWADQDFAQVVHDSVREHARTPFRESVWNTLAEGFRFVSGDFDDDAGVRHARRHRRGAVDEHAAPAATRVLPVGAAEVVPDGVPAARRARSRRRLRRRTGAAGDPWRRVVIEKPFGHDLASAQELNGVVEAVFPQDSVFRIDHYLGKETVQNILALRFANQLFEPVWNANYVDHVQITMAEDIGIGGRAGYYDGIGAARDVIQNHLLQLLALTAMEEPVSFDADDLRAEKEKVLSAVRLPKDLAACDGARPVRGRAGRAGRRSSATSRRRASPARPPPRRSRRSSCDIDTRRWAGVPFYLRTGKRLGRRVTEIAVVFKRAPHLPFESTATEELGQNALVIRVQPDEGVTIRFGSKVPGTTMEVRDVTMDFGYGHAFTESSPEAYERLILDVLLGDPPLFPRHEEVELSWRILDPVLRQLGVARASPSRTAPAAGARRPPTRCSPATGRTWRRP